MEIRDRDGALLYSSTSETLAGADLRNANLARANLSGATLRGADLTGADLENAISASRGPSSHLSASPEGRQDPAAEE